MPEMPEVQALAERLDEVLAGAPLDALRHAAVLVAEDLRAEAGRGARPHDRARDAAAGSIVVVELDGGLRVLVHLSQGGRVDVEAPPKSTKPRGAVLRIRAHDRPERAREGVRQGAQGRLVGARGRRRRSAREARPRGRRAPRPTSCSARATTPGASTRSCATNARSPGSAAATATTSCTGRSSRPTRALAKLDRRRAGTADRGDARDPRRRARGRAAATGGLPDEDRRPLHRAQPGGGALPVLRRRPAPRVLRVARGRRTAPTARPAARCSPTAA